jgi:AraC family transcriptional regulator
VDVACLYFTPQSLETALGKEIFVSSRWELRPTLAMRAPAIAGLIRSMTKDTQMGQPYGRMRGEALFQQLATLLIADGRLLKDKQYKAGIGDRRVRRALDYIHAHFCEELDLERIAEASETSPFHLARLFRQATGYPVWRYVSRLRVTVAVGLMKDSALTLTEVATLAGFASYSTFAATFSSERGHSPSYFRRFR